MAKGRSSRGNAHYTPKSLTSLLALSSPTAIGTYGTLAQALKEATDYGVPDAVLKSDDRRYYQPDRVSRPAGSLIRAATRLHITSPIHVAKGYAKAETFRRLGMHPPHTVSFRMPNYVSICVRRKIRREVYLALTQKRRRGSGAARRRNFWSDVKC